MHWSIFAGNLVAGILGVADQLAGTGVVASLGPWGPIGLAALNIAGHAVLSATGQITTAPAAPPAGGAK